jgi:hypothetical protein
MMLVVVIIGASIERGKRVHNGWNSLLDAFMPSDVEVWRHLSDSTGTLDPNHNPGACTFVP